MTTVFQEGGTGQVILGQAAECGFKWVTLEGEPSGVTNEDEGATDGEEERLSFGIVIMYSININSE